MPLISTSFVIEAMVELACNLGMAGHISGVMVYE